MRCSRSKGRGSSPSATFGLRLIDSVSYALRENPHFIASQIQLPELADLSYSLIFSKVAFSMLPNWQLLTPFLFRLHTYRMSAIDALVLVIWGDRWRSVRPRLFAVLHRMQETVASDLPPSAGVTGVRHTE